MRRIYLSFLFVLPMASNISAAEILEIEHLVRIQDVDPAIVLDLRYATADNFTHKQVYPMAKGILRLETARKLAAANAEFQKSGYAVKVWDGYRPVYVQKIFWDLVPDDRYVANPYKGGSRHNRGGAVDITLVDTEGREVEMPSAFDDFSSRAWPNNFAMSTQARKNVTLLRRVMMAHGFTPLEHEWWHFDDQDWRNFPIIDVPLEKF
jgi:zinc D-Ala-D-Ala dipeptidase